jgi:hypothetical protein
MKRTPLQRKTGFKPRQKPLQRHTKLRVEGHTETAEVKREIQDVARDIVIIRDGGCILRAQFRLMAMGVIPSCGGYRKDGQLILQADHLITRGNSATYADTRLIVCVCAAHHGWKSLGGNARKKKYDELVRTLITPERVALWDRCEQDSWRPKRTYALDWKLQLAALKQELSKVSSVR